MNFTDYHIFFVGKYASPYVEGGNRNNPLRSG